jgi:hypothetical protein
MTDFMLLLSGEVKENPSLSLEEKQQEMQKYLHWLTNLKEKGIVKAGQPLGNSGTKIQNANGIITDGPFVETKEAIGGYFIVAAENLDAAAGVAKTCPHVIMGGSIEVRPLHEI